MQQPDFVDDELRRTSSEPVMPPPPVREETGAVRFRKKPVEISAVRWTGTNFDDVLALVDFDKLPPDGVHVDPGVGYTATGELSIPTLEGVMTAQPGDWIIQGVAGEVYPCKPAIFEATYEPASASSSKDEGGGVQAAARALCELDSRHAMGLARGDTDDDHAAIIARTAIKAAGAPLVAPSVSQQAHVYCDLRQVIGDAIEPFAMTDDDAVVDAVARAIESAGLPVSQQGTGERCPACGVSKQQVLRKHDEVAELVRRAAPFVNAVAAMAEDKGPALTWLADAAGRIEPVDAASAPSLQEGGGHG